MNESQHEFQNKSDAPDPPWQTLADQMTGRIDALAVSQNRWRRTCLLLFLVLAGLITIIMVEMFMVRPVVTAHSVVRATGDVSTGVLTAHGLTLVDESGRTRVSIGTTAIGETRFDMFDPAGMARVSLELSTDGTPNLLFADDQNRERIRLGTASHGLPLFVMQDAASHPRVTLALTDSAGPALILADDHGNARMTWALLENGWPKLSFLSSTQQTALDITAGPQQTGIQLWDKNAKSRATFQLNKQGAAQIQFYDPLGNLFYFAP